VGGCGRDGDKEDNGGEEDDGDVVDRPNMVCDSSSAPPRVEYRSTRPPPPLAGYSKANPIYRALARYSGAPVVSVSWARPSSMDRVEAWVHFFIYITRKFEQIMTLGFYITREFEQISNL
jgi:hypothetical protein